MRRLLTLTMFAVAAAGATGCSTPQPCCRPTPAPCNSCNSFAPSFGGAGMETYGPPTVQTTPGMIVPGTIGSGTLTPGPQTYTPSLP
jgi:hypothetical protein